MKKVMDLSRTTCGALALALALCATQGTVRAQSVSDETVKRLIEYAWLQLPPQFSTADGRTIQIDKAQRDKIMVPLEVAREVVIASDRTARAEICSLVEEAVNNYRSMMSRELVKKKWSDQQIVFINVLQLTTVQISTGDATIKLTDDGGKVIEKTLPTNRTKAQCTDADRVKLREQIETYIAQGPLMPEPAPTTTSSTTPAAPANKPVAASEPKKP